MAFIIGLYNIQISFLNSEFVQYIDEHFPFLKIGLLRGHSPFTGKSGILFPEYEQLYSPFLT